MKLRGFISGIFLFALVACCPYVRAQGAARSSPPNAGVATLFHFAADDQLSACSSDAPNRIGHWTDFSRPARALHRRRGKKLTIKWTQVSFTCFYSPGPEIPRRVLVAQRDWIDSKASRGPPSSGSL